MNANFTQEQEQEYLIGQKRVKNILGFYTHIGVTIIIIPFLIFTNLKLDPHFHWFWFATGILLLILSIHWVNVFLLHKSKYAKNWKQEKMREIMEKDSQNYVESDFIQEQEYIRIKKKVREVRGFYAHVIVNIISIPIIIYVNLKFVPGFHFFWPAVVGMILANFFHWFGVYGFELTGLGKSWQERKIKEIIAKQKNNK